MARVRLLHVPRHEWRCRADGPVFGEHEQPQFRRPPRRRRAHSARQSADSGGLRRAWPRHRPARVALTMAPLKTLRSRTAVLPAANIDTDQIIPARFLTTTTREGLGQHLFADWRYDAQGAPRPDFALNRPAAQGCQILVAGRNFGCGSSREHAPWALTDYGFRAVVSTSFADIFRNNSLKNGLLPLIVPADLHRRLLAAPGVEITISLEDRRLTLADGTSAEFPIDSFARYCLMHGQDELAFLLAQDADIERFEATRRAS